MAHRQFADILADDATLLYFIRHWATSRRRSIGYLVFRLLNLTRVGWQLVCPPLADSFNILVGK